MARSKLRKELRLRRGVFVCWMRRKRRMEPDRASGRNLNGDWKSNTGQSDIVICWFASLDRHMSIVDMLGWSMWQNQSCTGSKEIPANLAISPASPTQWPRWTTWGGLAKWIMFGKLRGNEWSRRNGRASVDAPLCAHRPCAHKRAQLGIGIANIRKKLFQTQTQTTTHES